MYNSIEEISEPDYLATILAEDEPEDDPLFDDPDDEDETDDPFSETDPQDER